MAASRSSGHLFVTQGHLGQMALDGVLVSTDADLVIEPTWAGLKPRRTSQLRLDGLGISNPYQPSGAGSPIARLADVAQKTPDLLRTVGHGVELLAGDVRETRQDGPSSRPRIGIPLVATGQGGQAGHRGLVLAQLIPLMQAQAERLGCDIVLTCLSRSSYAAAQYERLRLGTESGLDSQLQSEARRLARLARSGDLVLFIGSGVSASAGLPDWKQLLRALCEGLDDLDPEELNDLQPEDAASFIRSRIDDDAEYQQRLQSQLDRRHYSLQHSLLASLKTRESVTTNFDVLYEKACRTPMNRRLKVLPWDSPAAQDPWLLKLHGDIRRGEMVLNRDDYVRFGSTRGPLGGLFQGLLMTRHLLFVGFSLRDENFIRLATEVRLLFERAGQRKQHRGTILDITPSRARSALWNPEFHTVEMNSVAGASDHGVRTLELFLDELGRLASAESSFLLDPTFTGLDRSEGLRSVGTKIQQLLPHLAALSQAERDDLAPLLTALIQMGADREQLGLPKNWKGV